jgi:hypothetical protein
MGQGRAPRGGADGGPAGGQSGVGEGEVDLWGLVQRGMTPVSDLITTGT